MRGPRPGAVYDAPIRTAFREATSLEFFRAGMGRLTDDVVASALGVSRARVEQVRVANGVPPVRHSTALRDIEVRTPAMDRPAVSTHRNAQLITTIRIVQLLREGSWRAEEIAGAIGQTKRTVYRALNALEAAGIRLTRHTERTGKEGREWAYYHVTPEALRAAGIY